MTNYVFLFFIPLIYSFPRLHCHPSTPHSPQPLLRSVPILSALGGGRPIATVMRGVNWPCCVFRRLDNDSGSGGLGGDNFLNFLRMPTCCFSHKLKSSPMRVLYPGGGRIKGRLSTWGLTYRPAPSTLFNYSGVALRCCVSSQSCVDLHFQGKLEKKKSRR